MAVITWGKPDDRVYQSGVSRAVIFPKDGRPGVPWSGLVEVSQNDFLESEIVYYDGVPKHIIVKSSEYTVDVVSLSVPEELLEFSGVMPIRSGVYFGDQKPIPFDFCYRTEISNGIDPKPIGYKIHLLWNIIAIPKSRSFETTESDLEASEFEWTFYPTPDSLEQWYRPSAYMTFQTLSMPADLLRLAEDYIYGSDSNDPVMPSLDAWITFFGTWT